MTQNKLKHKHKLGEKQKHEHRKKSYHHDDDDRKPQRSSKYPYFEDRDSVLNIDDGDYEDDEHTETYYSETEYSYSDDHDTDDERQVNICAICCFPCCWWIGEDLWIALIVLACVDLSESVSIFISAPAMGTLLGRVFLIFAVLIGIMSIVCPICYLISTASCMKDNLDMRKKLVKVYWIFRLCEVIFTFISLIWVSIEAPNYLFDIAITFLAVNLALSIHWFFVTHECLKQLEFQ